MFSQFFKATLSSNCWDLNPVNLVLFCPYLLHYSASINQGMNQQWLKHEKINPHSKIFYTCPMEKIYSY